MITILTYHSQVLSGNEYGCNDHVSLAADLRMIDALGKKLVPLQWAIEWARGEREMDAANCVCLTFDDGAILDWEDVIYPQQGHQRGFSGILEDFLAEIGSSRQPHVQATSFVIACAQARQAMDQKSLFGLDWMSDHWWQSAEESGLIQIENHSWDHFHPDAAPTNSGQFADIDSQASCQAQLCAASQHIEAITGRRPRHFAYPGGQFSEYLRHTYLPAFQDDHQLEAAFTIDAGYLQRTTDLWAVPRFVSMQHWRTPQALHDILKGQAA